MKFNKLIPELSVSNINNSKNFYINILGFDLKYERIENKFVFLELEESQIMIEEINNNWNTAKLEYPFGRGINISIEVSCIDDIYNRLIQNKYPIFKDIMINEYSSNERIMRQKEFLVLDPDGYLLRFNQDF